jgi:hypothetical protein
LSEVEFINFLFARERERESSVDSSRKLRSKENYMNKQQQILKYRTIANLSLHSTLRHYRNVYIGTAVSRLVRAPGYRSRGPGSISGASRFSEE